MRSFFIALFALILATPVVAQTVTDQAVYENAGKIDIAVAVPSAMKLSVSTIDGTAKASVDYTRRSGSLTFTAAGSKIMSVPIINRAGSQGARYFYVRAKKTGQGGSTSTAKITIIETEPTTTPTTHSCPDGSVLPISQECPVTPPPTPTQTCPDGSVIPVTSTCPAPPPVTSSFTPTTSIAANLTPIPTTDFNVAEGVKPVAIPKSASPDVVGAFRFVCKIDAVEFPWMLSYDDPILYPGQPGKAHLHQFYGNTQTDIGMANYESLRAKGGSLCNQIGDQKTKALNRSLYWQAAMIEYGSMKVVQPNHLQIYYKNRPDSDIHCTGPPNTTNSTVQSDGDCAPLPDGLRFIFGFDPTLSTQLKTGLPKFSCKGAGISSSVTYADLSNINTWCPKGQGNELVWDIAAPSCWDGVNLDSANHRDHVAYPVRNNNTGLSACPLTHPKKIPGFTLKAFYSLNADDSPETWDFSCRMLAPTLPRGSCGHADFYMAWDPATKNKWNVLGCIDNLLNCASGDMGMGEMLVGATAPIYGTVSLSINPHHKIPIPAAPAGAMAP